MACRLRIAVCNLQSGIGVTRGYWQYVTQGWKYVLPHGSQPIERAADFMREERIDLALLNEIEGGSRRSAGIDQLALLADGAGLPHRAFFPTFVVARRVNQGNAACVRWPLLASNNHPLPGHGEPRFLSEGEFTLAGASCSFFITHLALERVLREPQIRRIAEHVGREDRPTLLAGDFNIREDAELELIDRTALERAATALTFPSWRPTRSLDHLFLSRHFKPTSAAAFDRFRFSDHLPLVAEVEFEPGDCT
jgi:endonuclease/exonuclease/phosphatase family metal-dependent hydrolase